MRPQRPAWAPRLVLALLRLAPAEFRHRFGDEIAWVFQEQWRHASRLQRVTLWLGGATDLLSAVLAEQARRQLGRWRRGRGPDHPKENIMHWKDSANSTNTLESLLSLIPGRAPGKLAEPRGRSRQRADRQLNAY